MRRERKRESEEKEGVGRGREDQKEPLPGGGSERRTYDKPVPRSAFITDINKGPGILFEFTAFVL